MPKVMECLLNRLQGANFITGQSQRVLHMNGLARKLADDAALLQVGADGRLRFARDEAQKVFRAALAQAFDGGSLGFVTLHIETADGNALELSVLPLAPPSSDPPASESELALINLRRQGEQTAVEEKLLIQRYKLSKAEADVVRMFAMGVSLRNIAKARNRTYVAVRNQLSAAKQKMGVRRQSEILLRINELSPRLLLNQHSREDSIKFGAKASCGVGP